MSIRVPKSCRVYTPDNLASAMVTAMKDDPTDLWLEPCFGKGAFIQALASMGIPPKRIVAIDLDKKPCDIDNLAITHRGTEFLAWSLSSDQRFSKIVGNPPFVSFRRLPRRLQLVADRLNCSWAGPNRGNSNLWFAFLRASLSLLKKGGNIGFIVPAAFDYADYAAVLRATIYKHFAEFEVHRCKKPLFEEARDGCVVLLGREYEMQNRNHSRYEYASSVELMDSLGSGRKVKEVVNVYRHAGNSHNRVSLGTIMEITIGCVTGDSRYFLLRESERLRLELPVRVLRPVLTRARHLRAASVTKGYWEKLKASNERVWLFRPETRHVNIPSVRRYLRLRITKGGCHRENFKVQNRKIWYQPNVPGATDGFLSGTSQLGPWISLNHWANVSATNTLYCVKFTRAMSRNERAAWALSLLTKEFREQFLRKTRTYPDGLAKIEPGDLAELTVTCPPYDCKGAYKTYQRAVRLLMRHGRSVAEDLAEQWLHHEPSHR